MSEGNKAVSDREKEQEAYKKTCDGYVEKALNRDPTVKFLLDRLISMGCKPPPGFMKCIDCGDRLAGGGFGVVEETVIVPPDTNNNNNNKLQQDIKDRQKQMEQKLACQKTYQENLKEQIENQKEGKTKLRLLPDIFLCQQHIRSEEHAFKSLAHELIHAIDLCRTNMDPINNCVQMACTEIRAENLSGECYWFHEMLNKKVNKLSGHNKECVKRRALLSVKANPNCKDCAEEAVEAAFERCYKDTFPFDRHPNLA